MGDNLFLAFALMLVLEGIVPFLTPTAWRDTFRRLIQLNDGQIRFIGLTAMLVGVVIIMFVK
ncbi:MAG TPA: DUF2065 domain-containing protein [Azospira sp.]|nr:DUF2065 domain-containing protein [Azospira sp.]